MDQQPIGESSIEEEDETGEMSQLAGFSQLMGLVPASDPDAADQAAGPTVDSAGQQAETGNASEVGAPPGGATSSQSPRTRKQPKQEEKWYSKPPSWLEAPWFHGFDGDLSGLWMALKASLSDAKDAQAEAVAAWKEVTEAREKEAALSNQKKRKEKIPGGTLSGGERATAKGLRARNESLRLAVADAKRTLKEERRQNQRVLAELQRLEQRAQIHAEDLEGLNASMTASETGSRTGNTGSPQKMLPGITSSPPGSAKPQTPREINSAASARKNGRTPRGAGAPSPRRPNTSGDAAAPLPKVV